jgi:hypothetical protein
LDFKGINASEKYTTKRDKKIILFGTKNFKATK